MAERKDGGPAFPVQNANYTHAYGGAPGMSLRDWFAGQVLSSVASYMIENAYKDETSREEGIINAVHLSYDIADAMVAERSGPTITDADLFNCWSGGVSPTPEEIARFDWLEVGGVRDVSEPGDNGTHMEACDDADAEFWSVYGHYRPTATHVGCECITDGPPGDKERAWAIAEHLGRLWNLPVRER
ncbi:hypothetical protein [Ancylobacter amanitiformis]|uniref:Uncharacterized protein n=1 Tax=Ancylobacter amanitiformis TaxID=217069 RepID=A0ABU0LQC3_9HYPH|nr:hypothetical protein [Ancylobacter amanitiformis]MDQ0510906.1 hypothetical protein [Ancylobacter amanitiformis]